MNEVKEEEFRKGQGDKGMNMENLIEKKLLTRYRVEEISEKTGLPVRKIITTDGLNIKDNMAAFVYLLLAGEGDRTTDRLLTLETLCKNIGQDLCNFEARIRKLEGRQPAVINPHQEMKP